MTMTHQLPPRTLAPLAQRPTMHAPTQFRTAQTARTAQAAQASEQGPAINLVFAAALGLAIIAAFVGFGGDAAANGPLEPVSEQSQLIDDTIEIYIVQPGDTLWAIATEVARPGEDIRPIVDSLKSLTGGAQLDIGQRIVIDHATIRG